MSSHTPGPWKPLQHFTDNNRDGALVIGPDEWHVAACWATNPAGRSIEETDANAMLIAAAPDLLAALVQLVDWATHPDTTDWLNRSGVLGNYGQAVIEANGAIARVHEGGSNCSGFTGISQLTRQRDNLLSALNHIEVDKDGDGFICREAMEQVREAMAATKGDQT